MTTEDETGRANQKKRTRMAIIEAGREIIRSGTPVTMPDVARAALVSEATAYRYFPDLATVSGPPPPCSSRNGRPSPYSLTVTSTGPTPSRSTL